MVLLFTLLVVFQLKHFCADYLLQGRFMLRKFSPDWSFFLPLVAHASIHAAMTLGIILFVAPEFWWLALIDGVIHFVMDRIKAGPRWLGRFSDKNKPSYWYCLGFDQFLHHLTHYGIIAVLLSHFN